MARDTANAALAADKAGNGGDMIDLQGMLHTDQKSHRQYRKHLSPALEHSQTRPLIGFLEIDG